MILRNILMYLRHYAAYAFFSALIGVIVDFSWFILKSDHKITLYNLWANIQPSLVIGTISTICVSIVVRRFKKLIAGYVANFIVVFILIVILFLLQNFNDPYAMIKYWLVILAVVEVMSSIMIVIAYKLNIIYNAKLDIKKASLGIK